ncbi:replicative DNA helicase, partial [Klebsiella pneumoniae]
ADGIGMGTIEDRAQQVILCAMLGRVPLQHIRSGDLSENEWGRISSAASCLLSWKDRLLIDDRSYLTPTELPPRRLK